MMIMFLISNGISIAGFRITFYAICILLGAISAYKLSQWFLKKRGFDPEAIENLFYIAFPAGIVGARIWYVIASWNEFAGQPFYKVFAIWEGGLAIQGGIIGGVIAGVIFMILRRPNIPVLLATDCIVPTIAVAQCIGRWGNFFNQEVYGKCVSNKYWSWLPNFIEDRITYVAEKDSGWITGWKTINDERVFLCEEGQVVQPLFLIEGVINLAGFFIIAFGIPALFKWISKKTNNKVSLADGDLMCAYLIWYGIVRAIMEPLRNSAFIMGNYASKYMAIAMIVIGCIGIVLCHIYRNKIKKKPILDTNVIPGSEAAEKAVNISEIVKKEKTTEEKTNESVDESLDDKEN